jgi:cytochrome P450
MAFAQMEMKLLAAHLLREYHWDLLPGQDLDLSLIPTRRPKDNLRVFFRRWHGEKAKG